MIRLLEVAAGAELGAMLILLAQLWRQLRAMPRRLQPAPWPPEWLPEPTRGAMVRPAEFGPLLQPLEVVERVRTVIFRDQMVALGDRFALATEDVRTEFVERWGFHWSYDLVSWLTA